MSFPAADPDRLRRRGFRLEYATMTWMVAEATIAITAGLVAASVALVGFGLDSVIELLSATIVVWQLRGEIAGQDRETRAVRLVSEILGHASIVITKDVYGHLVEGDKRPAAELMSRALFGG